MFLDVPGDAARVQRLWRLLGVSMTDRFKRHGSMTDDERALIGLDRRRVATPVDGVTVDDPDADAFAAEDHFTPVVAVMERAVDLTDRERYLLQLVWRHTANMEMRSRKRSDSQDTSILAKEIDDLKTAITDIVGKSGNNGKVGAIKERLDKTEARRWWVITYAAGLFVAVVTAAIAFGVWKGSIETDVKALKRAVYRSQDFSPETPAKDERQ